MLEKRGNIKVKSLGNRKETVYDIEVKNNHNFFANDILVHNSVYISIKNIVNKKCPNGTRDEKLEFCDNFAKHVIERILREKFEAMKDYMNCYSGNMRMTREVIANKAIWCKKKRYAMSVLDNEGYRYQTPNIKISGLEIIKSNTPKFCAKELKEIVGDILKEVPEQQVVDRIDKFEDLYKQTHISEISQNTSVNYIEKYLDNGYHTKGAQAHIRAAINYNRYIKENDLDFEEIYEGDKIKIVPLIEPNPVGDNYIGFINQFPEELTEFIDYKESFKKTFTTPLEKVTTVINWDLKPQSSAAGLF